MMGCDGGTVVVPAAACAAQWRFLPLLMSPLLLMISSSFPWSSPRLLCLYVMLQPPPP